MNAGEGGGMRLQRSELAVPAMSEHFFAKAAASAADVVFLDLEDAVSPSRKEQARAGAIRALTEVDWGRKTLALRINGLDTPWAHRDILDVVSAAPRLDLVLLPKAGSAFDVRFVEQLLLLIEREHHRSRQVGIEVLIETSKGVANVEEIAGASGRLEAMIFGIGDYTVDMQTFDTIYGTPSPRYSILTAKEGERRERHWNDQWHFAMARIANACRANGLRPIDGPFTDFGDPEGYRASALRAAALGFEGKWAIHPTQVALANEVFTPSPEQIGWARKVGDAVRRANADGKGAIGMDGVLVDMAHARQADAMLRRAEAIRRQEAPL